MKESKLLVSCKIASLLIEKENIVGLTKLEKVKLTIHLSLCSTCKTYKDESGEIENLLQSIHKEERKLTAEEKSDLLDALFNEE